MKRQVSLEEISDGRLYDENDMVRLGCDGCGGRSACCRGMGKSAVLDPLDIYRLTAQLGYTFEELLTDRIELNVVDGIILPNLKMEEEDEACAFLDGQGRCSIHPQRPGVCRLFPLGRYYEPDGAGNSFRYFVQARECPYPARAKVKIRKWLDTPQIDRYEQFVGDWHALLEEVQTHLAQMGDEEKKQANLFLLKVFFIHPYHGTDFYEQFERRLALAREALLSANP